MDLKLFSKEGGTKAIATIKARRHSSLANKYSYRVDPIGAHMFWHHARAAERFDRISRGKTPFHEENLQEMALAKRAIKRLTRRVLGQSILQKRKQFHKKKATAAIKRYDYKAFDHHDKIVKRYNRIQGGHSPFQKPHVFDPRDCV